MKKTPVPLNKSEFAALLKKMPLDAFGKFVYSKFRKTVKQVKFDAYKCDLIMKRGKGTTTGDVILVAAGEDIAEVALPSSGLPPLLTAIAAHRAPHLGVLGGWLCVIRVPPLIEHLAEATLPARVLIILTMPYGAPITLRLDLRGGQACTRRAKHII